MFTSNRPRQTQTKPFCSYSCVHYYSQVCLSLSDLTFNEILNASIASDALRNLPDNGCIKVDRNSINFESIDPDFKQRRNAIFQNRKVL